MVGQDPVLIEYEVIRNISIIAFSNDLNMTTMPLVSKYLNPLIEEIKGSSLIKFTILDLRHVHFIDSVGMGMLSGKYVSLKRAEKQLVLCDANTTIQTSLRNTQLDQVLTVYTDRRDAVASLSA